MTPDVKLYSNTINNLIKEAKKIKKFGAIGPIYSDERYKYKKNIIQEEKKIIAAAMLVQTQIFKQINGYDKNFFLYYEDNDFFKKCNISKLKLYFVTSSIFSHTNIKKIRYFEFTFNTFFK